MVKGKDPLIRNESWYGMKLNEEAKKYGTESSNAVCYQRKGIASET
jgi:hypothetical protein